MKRAYGVKWLGVVRPLLAWQTKFLKEVTVNQLYLKMAIKT
jgi:hypothetical protein